MRRTEIATVAPLTLLIKRCFLVAFLTATVIALMAVIGLLLLASGREVGMVLLSALGEGFLLAGAFVGFLSFDRPWLRPFSIIGWAVSALMMLEFPLWAWMEFTRASPYSHYYRGVESLTGSGMVVAGLVNFGPVVFIPRLNFLGKWLQAASAACLTFCALLLLSLIWDVVRASDTFVTLSTSSFAFSIASALAVFALGKFSLLKLPDPVSSVKTTMRVFCPRCGLDQELAMGESACSGCKLRFMIDVEEPRCPKCGYNLNQLQGARCPECGWALAPVSDGILTP